METGEVEVKGTRELKGMTELTGTQGETQELEIIPETQELEEGDKLHETEIREEHTHVELVRDIEVERVECVETQCDGRSNLP